MIKRELITFLVVGVLTVLIDYISYMTLYHFNILNVGYAKAGGFICGTVFAYFANRMWTFGHRKSTRRSIPKFILLYTVTLGANVAINSSSLILMSGIEYSILIAFVIATTVSSCLNFIGMKFFVFKHNPS
ncbi:GtrA family protein [Cellvibrio sp. PSBB023]|uniref:GtrA family protein n=1 Tax=Cellvibrio sp. PSBB023 TaxID=1945512 RepID=UPI00098F10F8|nr:hypothetical protein B0D95_15685 [Cellvibrio sp. PSBB023]